jgi:protein-tyrosine phosphatase
MPKNLFNFRDLGGLETHCDRRVRSNKLFRVGNIGDIEKDSANFLIEQKQVSTYIDFRTTEEIDRFGKPQPLIERGAEWVNLHIDTNDPIFIALQRPQPEDWIGLYIRLFEKNAAEWVRFIKIVKEAKGAVIYGCLFGKDRTGIATSMLLHNLNVRDEHILRDYAKTGSSMFPHVMRLKSIWEGSKLTPEEQVKHFLETPEVIIENFLKHYRTSAANEIKHIIDELGESDRKELQQKLLEPK